MAEYLVKDTELTAVADAIRAKTGESGALVFPQGFADAIAEITTGGSDEQFALITVTVKRSGSALAGATVTATKGSTVVTGTSDANGQCVLRVTETGTYSIKATYEGITSSSGSVTVSGFAYSSNLTFFTATITVATETGATVTVTDGTNTYTAVGEDMQAVVTVYATGNYTVTSSYNGNSLSKEVNVTASTNYNLTIFSSHLILEETTWETISQLSAEGKPQNYFAVGDTKSVRINGMIVNDTFDVTLYAYIIGFNHNESVEGKGIHFGTFKTADGKDVALCEGYYGTRRGASTEFGFSYGNASNKSMVIMHDNVFGHTTGYNFDAGTKYVKQYAADTDKTAPKQNTFLAALPTDLRTVLKKHRKRTFIETSSSTSGDCVLTTEYFLTLPSEYEVYGTTVNLAHNTEAANPEEYQKQYEYYAEGNSRNKYKHNDTATLCKWWLRENPYLNTTDATNKFGTGNTNSTASNENGAMSLGLAPIFVV